MTIYIPIGMQCSVATMLKDNNLRTCSYPFDWILSNPSFVYTMFSLLLKDNISIDVLVRDHFFRNDEKCWYNKEEHYKFQSDGKAICNTLYNVVFPHDEYNE